MKQKIHLLGECIKLCVDGLFERDTYLSDDLVRVTQFAQILNYALYRRDLSFECSEVAFCRQFEHGGDSLHHWIDLTLGVEAKALQPRQLGNVDLDVGDGRSWELIGFLQSRGSILCCEYNLGLKVVSLYGFMHILTSFFFTLN